MLCILQILLSQAKSFYYSYGNSNHVLNSFTDEFFNLYDVLHTSQSFYQVPGLKQV